MRPGAIDSAIHAAREAFAPLGRLLFEERMRGLGRGSLPLILARITRDMHRTACDAAAVRLAQIDGDNARSYDDTLCQRLPELHADAMKEFDGAFPDHGRYPANRDPALRAKLETDMNDDAGAVVKNLSLGIAGGENVARQKGISITTSGSTNLAVDSPYARQTMNLTQTNTTSCLDPAVATELLSFVREQIGQASLAIEHRDEIVDEVIAAEHELKEPEPNPARLKRLLRKIGDKFIELGFELVAKVIRDKMIGM